MKDFKKGYIAMDDKMKAHVPYRRLTSGPGCHWFGCYDKHEFDPTDRFVLGMRVDFEDRDLAPDDGITIGMVDTQEDDAWVELGTSKAWCRQQGCTLQWLPGSTDTVVWNDREDDHLVCRLLNVAKLRKEFAHDDTTAEPDHL